MACGFVSGEELVILLLPVIGNDVTGFMGKAQISQRNHRFVTQFHLTDMKKKSVINY